MKTIQEITEIPIEQVPVFLLKWELFLKDIEGENRANQFQEINIKQYNSKNCGKRYFYK